MNPFEYGRELGLAELVDREDELRDIEATIRNRGKLFLIGPRRYGKTSLLSAAHEVARKRGTVVIRLDAEKYESLDLLAGALLTVATRELKGPFEKTMALVRDIASRLRPEFVVDGENVVVRIGASAGRDELPLLGEALDAIERLAERTGKEVVVILDEVQQIVVEHGIAAERQLRSVVQTHRHVGYVFAGSATRLLTAMTQDADRPFYRLGSRIYLGAIPRDAFLDFLMRTFEASGIGIESGTAEQILEVAEEVPYNVQRLAHEIWEIARSAKSGARAPDARVTVNLVKEALHRVVQRDDAAYTQIWTGLTSNQKKALKAVIASGRDVFSGETQRKFKISSSSLHRAVEALETAHLIRVDASRGETRYRLVDPFFTAWLRFSQLG